jgi:hypothetical protein
MAPVSDCGYLVSLDEQRPHDTLSSEGSAAVGSAPALHSNDAEVSMRLRIVGPSALLIVTAQLVSAQNPPDGTRVVVTGCVTQAQRTGSLAGTGVGAEAKPNTAAKEANSGELLNAYLLNDATPATPSGAANESADAARGTSGERTAYALEGQENELAKYKGQRVEIAGTLKPSKPSATGANTPTLAAGIRLVQVESVKGIVGEACTVSPEK